jgi:hypothetical protein
MITGRELCGDDELAYERSRTRFDPEAGMTLDDTYCLAHLPLIDPSHPRTIPSKDGTHYQMGRHPRVFSLVLPIPGEALRQSRAYCELEDQLRGSPFSRKVAWRLLDHRRDKVHATICGSLSTDRPPWIDPAIRRELASSGPVLVEVRGLFSGNVNRGRLYLRVYPERRNGANMFHQIQRVLSRPVTDLYVVGLWNLVDDLDPDEATALSSMIERWWNRPILRFEADSLWLLAASDDLVLDSSVCEILPLSLNR